jgi:hypothetical protein
MKRGVRMPGKGPWRFDLDERSHGHPIAKGAKLKPLMAELLG